MTGSLSFGTVLERLGELGAGYLAGTQEREDAARAERMKLISTGLQLGASGINAANFLGPDTVSKDNAKWLDTTFAPMGDQFTKPFRASQERQIAASQADREFQLRLEEYRQRMNERRTTITSNATMAAAALRAGDKDSEMKVLDELRLDEVTDTLIARQFAQMFNNGKDAQGNDIGQVYGPDGKIKPEFAPALSDFQDRIRQRIGKPTSLAELRDKITSASQELAPTVTRTDNRLNPFGSRSYGAQYQAQDPNAQLQAFVAAAQQQIDRQPVPSSREATRRQALAEIEARLGPAARAAAEKALTR